jgi:hypothetical protein
MTLGILHWSQVWARTITNTSAPQVVGPSPSNPKATRLEKSTEGDSNYDHALISQ